MRTYENLKAEYDQTKIELDNLKKYFDKKDKSVEDYFHIQQRDPELVKDINKLYDKLSRLKLKMNQVRMRSMNK